MSFKIGIGPSCWGVDDPSNPYLPKWTRVLDEAGSAGYSGIELGPYGYLPLDAEIVAPELEKNGLTITAGTIFNDLIHAENRANLLKQTDDICRVVTSLPGGKQLEGQRFPTPYLTIMDFGHKERSFQAGHPDTAPRLSGEEQKDLIRTIREISELAWEKYGVRPVIHPHAGGYIEFADEIDMLANELPSELTGFCFDTGHLYYSKMDPEEWIRKYQSRIDYVHFKDIDLKIYEEMMKIDIDFFDACARGVMCPIGMGIIDYKRIKQVLVDIGYSGWITIEQERDPRNADGSLGDVKKSRDYLKKAGFR